MTKVIADDLKLHIRLLGSLVHLKESVAEQSQEGKYQDHEGEEVTAGNMFAIDINTAFVYSILLDVYLHLLDTIDIILYPLHGIFSFIQRFGAVVV